MVPLNLMFMELKMNKNQVDGAFKQVKGSVKEIVGKVTGNAGLEAEGTAEKISGKVQEGVGKVQGTIKDTADKIRKD